MTTLVPVLKKIITNFSFQFNKMIADLTIQNSLKK